MVAHHDAYYLGAPQWAIWPFNADDCTIFERRGGRRRHAPAAGFVIGSSYPRPSIARDGVHDAVSASLVRL